MLAIIDYSIPKLFNERSAVLAVVFLIMAFFVSPLFPLGRRTQDILTVIYLPAIFFWWFIFQFQLVSLTPGVHYYLGRNGGFTWMMNSGICYAFGLAFSIRLLRLSRDWPRVIGGVFGVLFLLLILSGDLCRPAMQST